MDRHFKDLQFITLQNEYPRDALSQFNILTSSKTKEYMCKITYFCLISARSRLVVFVFLWPSPGRLVYHAVSRKCDDMIVRGILTLLAQSFFPSYS